MNSRPFDLHNRPMTVRNERQHLTLAAFPKPRKTKLLRLFGDVLSGLVLLLTLVGLAGCTTPRVWYQLGKTEEDAHRDLAASKAEAARMSNPLAMANGWFWFGNEVNKNTFIENSMVARGYQFGDPIQGRFDALQKVIDWFAAYPGAEDRPAKAKEVDDKFALWVSWCAAHPSGGIIPDGAGGTLEIPRSRMIFIRRELQKKFQAWKQLRKNIP